MDHNIKWVGCDGENYEQGGAVDPKTGVKHVPIAIVNHIMQGSLDGTTQWFHNPQAQASTNYGVGKDGRIFHFVQEGVDRPFANGAYCNETWTEFIRRGDGSIVNPNRYTISIEHEGNTGEPFTEKMYQATLWLQKELIKKWNIPIDRNHIIGHYQIDGCTRAHCPGDGFPWSRLMKDLVEWKVNEEVSKVLEKWQLEIGLKAVEFLGNDGILNNPETWAKEEELAKPVPTWLFFEITKRILNKAGVK